MLDSFDGINLNIDALGLPLSCTTDTVLLRYLDLLRLRARKGHEPGDVDAHVRVLAGAVRHEASAVRRRLSQLAA